MMIKETTEKLSILMSGEIPDRIDTTLAGTEEELNLAKMTNKLIRCLAEIHEFIIPLSQGELSDIKISLSNLLGSPFEELHSRLLHLTWQANQIASGDYSQRIDFMGMFSEAFNNMVVSLDNNEKMLKNKINELEKALSHIVKLEGILPICSHCKKIRVNDAEPDDQKNWLPIESYISEKTDARFSHSVCPTCMEQHYFDEIN